MQLVDLVIDRGTVTVALLRHHVDDHGLAQFLRAGQDLFEGRLVVTVDQACVLDAEALEHRRRLKQLLQALLHAIGSLVGGRANQRKVTQEARDLIFDALVPRIDAKLRKMMRKAAHGGRVGAPVVVDHDDEVRRLKVSDLVQRFVRHPAGQRTVADHRDDKPADPPAQSRFGEAKRVAQRGRRVAVLDQVVLGFFP